MNSDYIDSHVLFRSNYLPVLTKLVSAYACIFGETRFATDFLNFLLAPIAIAYTHTLSFCKAKYPYSYTLSDLYLRLGFFVPSRSKFTTSINIYHNLRQALMHHSQLSPLLSPRFSTCIEQLDLSNATFDHNLRSSLLKYVPQDLIDFIPWSLLESLDKNNFIEFPVAHSKLFFRDYFIFDESFLYSLSYSLSQRRVSLFGAPHGGSYFQYHTYPPNPIHALEYYFCTDYRVPRYIDLNEGGRLDAALSHKNIFRLKRSTFKQYTFSRLTSKTLLCLPLVNDDNISIIMQDIAVIISSFPGLSLKLHPKQQLYCSSSYNTLTSFPCSSKINPLIDTIIIYGLLSSIAYDVSIFCFRTIWFFATSSMLESIDSCYLSFLASKASYRDDYFIEIKSIHILSSLNFSSFVFPWW